MPQKERGGKRKEVEKEGPEREGGRGTDRRWRERKWAKGKILGKFTYLPQNATFYNLLMCRERGISFVKVE